MTTNKNKYHIPVLLNESINGLNISPDGIYVDLTFGGGGHSKVIFNKLSEKGRLIAFDQDEDARGNIWKASNFLFIASNFSFLKNQLKINGISKVDGIIADLGVSSHQFDEPSRGFSIRLNEKLDMRMNQKSDFSAYELINQYTEEELTKLLNAYGEIRTANLVAKEIVKKRLVSPITTTGELLELLLPYASKFKENKFYSQVFQAIRIEVNNELGALKEMLLQSVEVLNPKGRLAVLSYHSLEDRLIKNYFKRGSFEGVVTKDFFGNVLKPFTEINRKPIVPTEKELKENTRARSAKLRIAERNENK